MPFSSAQMYDLVNDPESYPEFLPWCESAIIDLLTEEKMCATLTVARAGIRQKFSTCNRLAPHDTIELHLEDGPFRHLHGIWNFVPLREDASKVSLRMEFEFSGRLINMAFGAVFSHIADNLVDAFCKRAREVYGD